MKITEMNINKKINFDKLSTQTEAVRYHPLSVDSSFAACTSVNTQAVPIIDKKTSKYS
jgi:anthranilate/para-aminobenzoate synthase component II